MPELHSLRGVVDEADSSQLDKVLEAPCEYSRYLVIGRWKKPSRVHVAVVQSCEVLAFSLITDQLTA